MQVIEIKEIEKKKKNKCIILQRPYGNGNKWRKIIFVTSVPWVEEQKRRIKKKEQR